MMSNFRPSPMSVLRVESKQFPIFRPDLDWETATSNNSNPFFVLTETSPSPCNPLNSEPTLPPHFLPYPSPLINYTNVGYTFPYPETDSPANFCSLVKPEFGVTDDDYDELTFFRHPVCENLTARIGFGLNLGHRTYFSSSDAAVINRLCRRSSRIGQPVPRCQAEGCEVDLSNAKHYHRRHKVCEFHSKATIAVIGGIQQRFCQQCSRFHVLAEFDEVKRSCRKRLADHNRRRRKTQSASAAVATCGSNAAESSCIMKVQHCASSSRGAFNDSLPSDAIIKEAKSAAVSQVASSQTSDGHGLLRATFPPSPPLPSVVINGTTNSKTAHKDQKLSDSLQLLQRVPYLSLGGLEQQKAMADSSSSPTMQNLTPPLFPWIVPSNCGLVSSHQQSPWCSPSAHNAGSDESSRGSISYQRQNRTEELQLHTSVFAVDQL